MRNDNKYISEFNEGQVVECTSGRYKIIKFKRELIKGKHQIKSAVCISDFSGKETIISVNLNKHFQLSSDQSFSW